MVMQTWILPILIAIVATYLLISILYNNNQSIIQKFSDLGALIQLQTSRPVYYVDFVPENQLVYNDVMKSYGYNVNNTKLPNAYQQTGYQLNDMPIELRHYIQPMSVPIY